MCYEACYHTIDEESYFDGGQKKGAGTLEPPIKVHEHPNSIFFAFIVDNGANILPSPNNAVGMSVK